jgi:3,4-dihydroxy 2-butanone 4-phosphate synthase / GTP cyclohydrolase II
MSICSVAELVSELSEGRMVILVDEEDRENEGDLVLAADHVSPAAINFMARFGRGLICLTLTRERCERLRLSPMTNRNGTQHGTAFTVSIEAAEGVTTGISAADRSRTVQAAVARDAQPGDLVQPGHIFPLQAQDGGVLMRAGHTEAGCDLAAMAGLSPAAVICEIMNDDGTMARLPDLLRFAETHQLRVGTIASLIEHRSRNETLITRVAQRSLQTAQGEFSCIEFRDRGGSAHLALTRGQWSRDDEVLVRVHEPLGVMDLLDVGSGDHSWPLHKALERLHVSPRSAAVLLNCTGQTAREANLLDAHPPTPLKGRAQLDLRTYGIGAQILRELGIGKMKLLGSPRRMPSMAGYGLEVTGFVAAEG